MDNFYALLETDLASRRSAADLRDVIEASLLHGKAVLDLSRVQSISESYADELFGVLVGHYSLSWVFSRLQVTGARPAVVKSITQAIRYRLERVVPEGISSQTPCQLRHVVKDAVEQHSIAFAAG